jgi:hypothetical protein
MVTARQATRGELSLSGLAGPRAGPGGRIPSPSSGQDEAVRARRGNYGICTRPLIRHSDLILATDQLAPLLCVSRNKLSTAGELTGRVPPGRQAKFAFLDH